MKPKLIEEFCIELKVKAYDPAPLLLHQEWLEADHPTLGPVKMVCGAGLGSDAMHVRIKGQTFEVRAGDILRALIDREEKSDADK